MQASGTGGLPFLTLTPTEAAKLVVGMRVRSGAGAAGAFVTDVNASTGVVTLSQALSVSSGATDPVTRTPASSAYIFDPTLTLSSPAGNPEDPLKVKATSLNPAQDTLTINSTSNPDVLDLSVGMQVISGDGASGRYITAIVNDPATNTVAVTFSSPLSYAAGSGFGTDDEFQFAPA